MPDEQQPSEQQRAEQPSRLHGVLERHPWLRVAGVAIVLLLVAGAVWWWWDLRRYQSTDDAQIDADIYPVSARVTGHIVRVRARDGQYVHAGDLLVEIDDKDYRAAFDRAKSDYTNASAAASAAQLEVPVSRVGSASQIRSAHADIATAEAGVAAAQNVVEQARAQLAQTQAAAKNANADVVRYRLLVEKREISQQQFDQAVAAADAANASVAAGTAAIRTAEEQVRQAQEKVHQAQAGLSNARATTMTVKATAARATSSAAQAESAKAALDQATLNLGYTRITAPIDGIVGRRTAQIGQNVEPGQELLTIVPTKDLWITANFKETQIGRMRGNEPVDISVDGCDRDLKGHVTSIGGATGARYSLLPPENATGNYVKVVQRIPVRIDLDASGDDRSHDERCLLRPGMSVVPSVKVR